MMDPSSDDPSILDCLPSLHYTEIARLNRQLLDCYLQLLTVLAGEGLDEQEESEEVLKGG